jgi:hypothetical protein
MDMLFSQFEPEMRISRQSTLAESRLKPGGRDNRCRGGPTNGDVPFASRLYETTKVPHLTDDGEWGRKTGRLMYALRFVGLAWFGLGLTRKEATGRILHGRKA